MTRSTDISYSARRGISSEMNATYSDFDEYTSWYGPIRVKSVGQARGEHGPVVPRSATSRYRSTTPSGMAVNYFRGSLMAFSAMMFFWTSVAPAPIDV